MIIAKILGGGDNNSYMYESEYPHLCETCNFATRQEVNPDFHLAHEQYDDSYIELHKVRKQYDVSYTCDHYLIVSKRFKQFCEEMSYKGAVFTALPSQPGFYFLESTRVIPLDYAKRKVKFIDLCEKCNRYAEVTGATPSYIQEGFAMEENSFYRSSYDFGSHNYRAPLVIVSLKMAREMSAQKFKGIFFDNVLSDKKEQQQDGINYLSQQKKEDGPHMGPQRGNPGWKIQNNFDLQQRKDVMKSFYDANKWRYPRARYDFYRNAGYKFSDWLKGLLPWWLQRY